MKIAFAGLSLPAGKFKYADPVFLALADKFQPDKLSPYYFEFIPDAFETTDAIVVKRDRLVDILIRDMEKIESRLERAENEIERTALKKCMAQLESEKPLCDIVMETGEMSAARALDPISMKPTIAVDNDGVDANALCKMAMDKARVMFFYTVGKKEVHAWFVESGASAITCAGKIHTDLARGFIKAEIVSFDNIMTAHSITDARSRGLTRLVDRDFTIEPNTILEIRFNV